jgi:hypothetical protein
VGSTHISRAIREGPSIPPIMHRRTSAVVVPLLVHDQDLASFDKRAEERGLVKHATTVGMRRNTNDVHAIAGDELKPTASTPPQADYGLHM